MHLEAERNREMQRDLFHDGESVCGRTQTACHLAAILVLCVLCVSSPPNVSAQQAQPHPGTPSSGAQGSHGSASLLFEPLPNFDVVESEVLEFDFYVFGYLQGTPRIEGRRTTTSYKSQFGKPMPGALGICRAFTAVVLQSGGKILYDNHRNIVTGRVVQDGRETWAEIACDKDRYRVNIVERDSQSVGGTAPGASDLPARKAEPGQLIKKHITQSKYEDSSATKTGSPAAGANFSIVQSNGSVLPCADKPTLIRRGYTKGCATTEPDKPRLCDLIASRQLYLVDTSAWSCHSKDGTAVEGALVTDRPLP